MATLFFTGWRPGFAKVSLNALLREQAQMSLSQAKTTVDRILERECVTVAIPDAQVAEELLRQARALGADGYIEVDTFIAQPRLSC